MMNAVTTKAYDFPDRTRKRPAPKALSTDHELRRHQMGERRKAGPYPPCTVIGLAIVASDEDNSN